jgi:hypothetical protein
MMYDSIATTNPFATRYTRPGAMQFHFPAGEDVMALVERLRSYHWTAQIVGPHGSGKSTLLATLIPAIETAGRQVRCIALHEGERRLPFTATDWGQLTSASVLIIDGYEQLGRFARWSVASRSRSRQCGLVVTTHRDLGLPTLFTMNPQLSLAIELAHELLPPGDRSIGDSDIEAAWHRRRGNVRELLFDLYDLFESRRATSG